MHAIESIALVKEPAWHGLGTIVEDTMKWEEAYKKGGLEWEISKQPIYTTRADSGELIEVPDTFGTVRSTDGSVMGIVGSKYKVVQNREAFDFMNSVVDAGELSYHVVGSLFGGQRIWLLARPKNARILIEGTEDESEPYILLYNGHDGKMSLGFKLTTVRVVCNNTLNLALGGLGNAFTIRHAGDIEAKVKVAQKVLGTSIIKFQEYNQLANALAKKDMNQESLTSFITYMMPSKNDADEDSTRLINSRLFLQDLFESGKGQQLAGIKGTAWAALNSITEYTTHYKGRDNPNTRLSNLWWGSSEDMNLKALDYLQSTFLGA